MSRLTHGLAIAAAAALLGVGYVDRSPERGRGAVRFKKRPTIKPTSEGLRPGKQFRLKGVRP